MNSRRVRPQHPWEAPWTVYWTGLEIFLIAHNSCVLITCLKILRQWIGSLGNTTFYRPEDYPMQQGEMQPDLSNYLFWNVSHTPQVKAEGQRNCCSPVKQKDITVISNLYRFLCFYFTQVLKYLISAATPKIELNGISFMVLKPLKNYMWKT